MSLLLHMLPVMPRVDMANRPLANPKMRRNLALAQTFRKHVLDLSNLGLGKFSPMSAFATRRRTQAHSVGMSHIFRASYPFQIVSAVIRLVPIFVVHMSSVARLKKCERDYLVNVRRLSSISFFKAYGKVSAAGRVLPEDAPLDTLRKPSHISRFASATFPDPIQGSDNAGSRDLINSLIIRDVAPIIQGIVFCGFHANEPNRSAALAQGGIACL